MDAYILDWASLIFRWLHLVTGIAWIGASFYFIWLDLSLETPPPEKAAKGVKGDLWAIHAGGFYEVAKYKLAPPQMPAHLHWFKWEAYSTWITGFCLLTILYYFKADVYLIDPSVFAMSKGQAIAMGVTTLILGWFIYDLLCRTPLVEKGLVFGFILFVLGVLFAYGLTHVFSGRGAYIHIGAMIGSIMAGNVFFVIIPSQRALVAAVKKGVAPDPSLGIAAKLRSTHNNYLTLPVLFIMISNHYPMTYGHRYNWAILSAVILITAFARHYFNLKHQGKKQPAILAVSAVAVIILAFVIMPKRLEPKPESTALAPVAFATVAPIIQARCLSCHSQKPTDELFAAPPGGIVLGKESEVIARIAKIKTAVVDTQIMPLANKTQMTPAEREVIRAWIEGISSSQ